MKHPISSIMKVNERTLERILEKRQRLDSLRPLDVGALERLKGNLIVEITYNSNSIEGNTLDLS